MRIDAKAIIGIVLSLLLLWWALRDVSPSEVVSEIRHADPLLFFISIVIATSVLIFRAIRWQILLRPVAPDLPFRPRLAATTIGLAANNLLPARIGEFARAYALGRITTVPVGSAFGALVVERLMDALGLITLLFVSMSFASFPADAQVAGMDPRGAATIVAAITGVIAVLLFLIVLAPERSVGIAESVGGRILPATAKRLVVDALRSFVTGLVALRRPKLLLLSLAWSFGQWLFLGTSLLIAFRAFGITEVGYAGALFLQSLIGVAVAIPSSPGFFGPFEAAARIGLGFWGVDPERAISFAVGYHIGGYIPITVLGLFYVWWLGLSWKEVGRSEEVVEEEIERTVPDTLPEPRRDA